MSIFNKNRYLNVKSFLIVGLLFCVVLLSASCKTKKNRSTGTPSNPVSAPNTDNASGEKCQTALTVLDLGPTEPSSLQLTSVDLEELKIGSFNSAKILFTLGEYSGIPDKFVYYACPAKDKRRCILGSSASTTDISSVIPEGSVNIKAWACITARRLPGPESEYQESRLNLKGLGIYYCGKPVEHYDHQRSNTSVREFANVQAEIDYLEAQAENVAFSLAENVKDHLSSKTYNLSGVTSNENICDNPRNPEEIILCNIAMNPAMFAEVVVNNNIERTAAAVSYAQNAPPFASLQLTNSDNSPCVPDLSDSAVNDIVTPPPQSVILPSKDIAPAVKGESSITQSKEDETRDVEDIKVASENKESLETSCRNRNEWFKSQNLGSAEWDSGLKRCFHVKDSGAKTEIDVSIDPNTLQPKMESSEEPDESKGNNMSASQKIGMAFMVTGGFIAAAGAGGLAIDKRYAQLSTSLSESKLSSVTQITSPEFRLDSLNETQRLILEDSGEKYSALEELDPRSGEIDIDSSNKIRITKQDGFRFDEMRVELSEKSLLEYKKFNTLSLELDDLESKARFNEDFDISRTDYNRFIEDLKKVYPLGLDDPRAAEFLSKNPSLYDDNSLEDMKRIGQSFELADQKILGKQTELFESRRLTMLGFLGDIETKAPSFNPDLYSRSKFQTLIDEDLLSIRRSTTSLSSVAEEIKLDPHRNIDSSGFKKILDIDPKLKKIAVTGGIAMLIVGGLMASGVFGLTKSGSSILNSDDYLENSRKLKMLLDEIEAKKQESILLYVSDKG